MKAVQDVLWAERTRQEIPAWAERGAVVIVPIASIEQHGLHLPLDTDCRTVEYVAREAARSLDDVPVLVTPIIPFGISPHHMAHPGTISIGVQTLVAFLRDACESIMAHGFDRILILSGHGGNTETIQAAAREFKYHHSRQIEADCWFYLVSDTINEVREGPCPSIGHAGEAETSCILTLSPESVRTDKLELVEDITDDPSIGTATKGERILQAAVKALAQHLREMAALPGRKVVRVKRYTSD